MIVVILAAVLINSCESSALHNSLQQYAISVNGLIKQSQATSERLFDELKQRGNASGQTSKNQIDEVLSGHGGAIAQLKSAEALSVPSQMTTAQAELILALKMRRDGLTTIASEIEPVLNTSSNQQALSKMAGGMSNFYASDVVYKSYVAPTIAAELNANGVAIGGTNGVPISGDQFLPSLGWLDPKTIATALGAHYVKPGNPNFPINPNLQHGSGLNSVSVAGQTLSPSAENSVTAKPAPTFSLSISNTGTATEYNVKCEVTVNGTSIHGSVTLTQTLPGQTYTCNVPLNRSPGPGQYTVVAKVDAVPGETHTSNNSASFPVTFE